MKRFKILWIVLGTIVVLVGGGFIFANYVIYTTLGKMTTTEKLEKEEAEIIVKKSSQRKKSRKLSILRFLESIKMAIKPMGVVML